MNPKVERLKEIKNNIKENIKSNQNVYIPVATFVSGLVVMYYVNSNNTGSVANTASNCTVGGDLQMAGRDVINHYHAPKHLSYIVRHGEDVFMTQADAAAALGLSPVQVSKHLNHGKPLPGGVELVREGVRASQ